MIRKLYVIALLGAALGCAGDAEQQVVRDPATQVSVADTGGPVVLFLGTSLTAGRGVSPDRAYPALIQGKIDSAGWEFRVVNAGVSGETTAGGLRRIEWLTARSDVAVLVLELGANDMLRGQDVESMRENLQAIIDRTRARHPGARIVIAGLRAAPNLGEAYGERFARTFVELAEANDAHLIPFLLKGVAGRRALNQPDGIHPNVAGHRVMAENVWRVLEPVLRRLRQRA